MLTSSSSSSCFDSESQRVDGELFESVVRQVHRRQIREARERVRRQFRDDVEVGLDLKSGEKERERVSQSWSGNSIFGGSVEATSSSSPQPASRVRPSAARAAAGDTSSHSEITDADDGDEDQQQQFGKRGDGADSGAGGA